MTKLSQSLRFAIIKNDGTSSAWQNWVVKYLIAEPNISLEAAYFYKEVTYLDEVENVNKGCIKKLPLLWRIFYNNWIKKKSKALRQVASYSELEKIPRHLIKLSIHEGCHASLDLETISALKEIEIDFIINFSEYKIVGEALGVTKHGIWDFSFSDGRSVPCLWEIYNNKPITRACLIGTSGIDRNRTLLKEGYLKTSISVVRNIDNLYSEASKWPLRICNVILKTNSTLAYKQMPLEAIETNISPRNYHLLLLGLIQFKFFVKKAFKALLYTDYWNIGIADVPIQKFLDPEIKPKIEWYPLLPFTHFMADPFALHFNDKLHIIYEDFKYNQGIGKIASMSFDSGSFEAQSIVIDEEFHMSYPFLIRHQNNIYCIPETYQKKQVRLYKAENFPSTWKFEKVLIDNYSGIDSTVLKYKNVWYLFSTNKDDGPHYNLNIHYSTSLFGPWEVHPQNPVKTDIRSARPAGTFFTSQGELYRPSMDYSEKVEGRIILNKIKVLTTSEFEEEVHTEINPFSDTYFSDKVHTLCQAGPYTLIDGAKELLVLRNLNVLNYKIKSILRKLNSSKR